MIGRLAVRSLTAHPIRTAVLAAGFGVGVAVMAILLGVAEVVLSQAQSPALVGGGDVVIRLEPTVPARLVLSGTLQADQLRSRIRSVSPAHTDALYLLGRSTPVRIEARGGIPSLERTMGDPEISVNAAWRDTSADASWTTTAPGDVLREIDRFHTIPNAPAWQDSWAEWLYFNGRAANAQFYLTFLVGSRLPDGTRSAGVRLQLDRGGHVETFSAPARLTDADTSAAPDLHIGSNHVALDGLRYVIDLDLKDERGRTARGRISIEAVPGRWVPPIEIGGARGWRTGYVVPVMSGRLDGTLDVTGEVVSFDDGIGYHDHNWGFWQGVSWQWGQVQQGDLSFIYGRVFPPREAADPDRVPGFIGGLGPDGPLGFATDVTITEQNDASGQPRVISVTGRSPVIDVRLRFDVGSVVSTRMEQGPIAAGVNFLQMRGEYTVSGRAGNRVVDFNAPGSAETFRGAP